MAGYSGTPLPAKLGIKEGHTVAFRSAPKGFERTLGELPDSVRVKRRVARPVDVIVAFFDSRAELERRFNALAAALDPAGGLWIAWPKRSSGVPTDMTEDVAREIAWPTGSSTTRSVQSTRSGRACAWSIGSRIARPAERRC